MVTPRIVGLSANTVGASGCTVLAGGIGTHGQLQTHAHIRLKLVIGEVKLHVPGGGGKKGAAFVTATRSKISDARCNRFGPNISKHTAP